MNPNPFLDGNCAEEFIEHTRNCSPNGLPAANIFDLRFWVDFSMQPSYEFPYSFCQHQRRLERTFEIMKVFKPHPTDYRSVREFCDLAQKVYDVVSLIRS